MKTKDGTAKGGRELDINGQPALNEKGGRDYEPYDQVIQLKKKETEKVISINIIDNDDWQPDLDFMIQLYDVNTN